MSNLATSIWLPPEDQKLLAETAQKQGLRWRQACLFTIRLYLSEAFDAQPLHKLGVERCKYSICLPRSLHKEICRWKSRHKDRHGYSSLIDSAIRYSLRKNKPHLFVVVCEGTPIATFSNRADAMLFLRANEQSSQRILTLGNRMGGAFGVPHHGTD